MASTGFNPSESFIIRNSSVFVKISDCPITWLCLLSSDSNWLINGRAKLSLLRVSKIQICGASICHDECVSFNVYSPSTHTPCDLRVPPCDALADLNFCDLLFLISNFSGISTTHLENLSDCPGFRSVDLSQYAVALMLQSLDSPIFQSLQQMTSFRMLFPSDFSHSIPEKVSIVGETFSFESASFNEVYIEASELRHFFDSLSNFQEIKKSKILICGPLNAGKSSLLRRLVNRLLSDHEAVAVFDCDPGQTEFTPPGVLSLTVVKNYIFGPPFSHPLDGLFHPKQQCFFGGTSPSINPSFYVNCLRYLFDAFSEIQDQCPLIINTMGWTQGLGLTLLIEQVAMTKPDKIVQLYLSGQRASARQNLPELTPQFLHQSCGWNHSDLSNESFSHQVIQIPSMSRGGPGGFTSAQDQRDLTLLAHLLSGLVNAPTSLPGSGRHGRGNTPLGHPTAHFLDCLPYRVPLTVDPNPDAKNAIAVHLLHQPSDIVNPMSVYSLPAITNYLSGTLVALCSVPEENIISPSETNHLTLLSEASPCECVGLAIVRAVDPISGVIYLTTGIPQEDLVKVNALIRGKVDLPHSLFTAYPWIEALLSYPETQNQQQLWNPYLGPLNPSGAGRAGLPIRRYTPRTMHRSTGYSLRDSTYF